MKGVVISVLLVLAMVQLMVKPGEATVSCQQVSDALRACVSYLVSDGSGKPSDDCCGGLGTLQKLAVTTEDKQAACNCAKDAAARIPAIKDQNAASLPAKCNIKINFPISRNTDCQNIR